MPDGKTHIGFGFALAIVLWFVFSNIGITNADSYAFVGVLAGSIMPDILDPPIDYKHRKFFHSRRVLRYMAIGSAGVALVLITPMFNLITFFCLGYFMHLALDSTTHMSLPE